MLISMFSVFFYISTVSGAQYGCFLQFLDVVLSQLIIIVIIIIITTNSWS